jgi:hypothetical protein
MGLPMSKFNSGIGLKKQRPKGQFSASGPGGSKFAQFLAPSGEDRSLHRWSKLTPDSGLRVYIKDYNKLHPAKASPANDKTK